uniref:Fibronectin type III domain-containing protein n=1 Tax=Cacopsylla melanoneura TaxID=428564 RepID=A0A8D8YZX9_9HEMI
MTDNIDDMDQLYPNDNNGSDEKIFMYYDPQPPPNNGIPPPPDILGTVPRGPIVIRTDEALIVISVLILWVAAIALFFNRWGKIRMLEPYQPKFHEETHRVSCPMADIAGVGHLQAHRASLSQYKVNNAMFDPSQPSPIFQTINPATHRSLNKVRQNSVFVETSTSSSTLPMSPPPRKVKSAIDLKTAINDCPMMRLASRSMQPMSAISPIDRRISYCGGTSSLNPGANLNTFRDRRVSCNFLSPTFTDYRRPSRSGECLSSLNKPCQEYLAPLPTSFPSTSTAGSRRTSDLFPSSKDSRRPSINNLIAQVTSERRCSSSLLRMNL